MKQTTRASGVHSLLALGLVLTIPQVAHADAQPCGYAIVQMQPGANIDSVDAANGTVRAGGDDSTGVYRIALPPATDPTQDVARVRATTGVAAAEQDQPTSVTDAEQSSGPFFEGAPTVTTYMGQYALGLIGATAAQSVTMGQGVTVAVLDTGVAFSHPALAGRLLPGYNALAPGTLPIDWPSGVDSNGDGSADDAVGHGTAVTGIVAAMAPAAQIMPVKVLDSDGWGTESALVDGIYYAVNHGARVINLSVGMSTTSTLVASALGYAASRDVVVVAAAGNTGARGLTYPASGQNVLAVAAVDARGVKAPFSSYGSGVDVSAPGVDIQSTYYDGGYASWSGTSMATPFVSAEVALWEAVSLNHGVSDAVARVKETAASVDARNPAYAGQLGAGLINVLASVSNT